MSRVGQTIIGNKGGRPVRLECISDGGRVVWRSVCLEFAGSMWPSDWDSIRARQHEEIKAEGREPHS